MYIGTSFPIMSNVNNMDTDTLTQQFNRLSDLKFNPFLAYDNIINNKDVEPDFQFYNDNENESNYFYPNQFADTFSKISKDNVFSSIHFNARSLLGKMDSFKMYPPYTRIRF